MMITKYTPVLFYTPLRRFGCSKRLEHLRGRSKIVQLDILDKKTCQKLYISKTYISPILVWA